MTDNIEPIIEDIKKRGYIALEDIIARKESEKYFIDFKLTQKDDYSGQRALFDSDKRNLARAISGFGNSEGGLIIWGIDASGSTDDYAKSIKPITGVDNFKSLLESFVSLLTLPAHRTVESIVVKKSKTETHGIVITVVPKGNDRPYQNIGDYKYYMRAGDSFVPVPHGVLQGMFGQTPQPNVFFMFNISKNPTIDSNKAMKWQAGLMAVNGGLGIGEDIYGFARVWTPGDNSKIAIEIVDKNNYDFYTAYGIEFSFMSKQGFRLGYEQRSQMMVINFWLLPPFTKKLYIDLLIGGRNQQVYRHKIERSAEDLEKIYKDCLSDPSPDRIEEIWGSEHKIT